VRLRQSSSLFEAKHLTLSSTLAYRRRSATFSHLIGPARRNILARAGKIILE
jgi:hypothetical protein